MDPGAVLLAALGGLDARRGRRLRVAVHVLRGLPCAAALLLLRNRLLLGRRCRLLTLRGRELLRRRGGLFLGRGVLLLVVVRGRRLFVGDGLRRTVLRSRLGLGLGLGLRCD